jgi:hypothetical protein
MSAFSLSMSGDARIALAPGVSIAGSAVQDEAAGQRYPLTGVAREILERLEGGRRWRTSRPPFRRATVCR